MRQFKFLAALSTLIISNLLLAGCSPQSIPPQSTASPVPAPTATATPKPILKLRAMTFKIACGVGANLEEFVKCDDSPFAIGSGITYTPDKAQPMADKAYGNLVEIVRKANPDVLALEDVYTWNTGDSSYLEKFAGDVNMSYYFPSHNGGGQYAILSKYPIIETENMKEGIARAVLQTPDGERLNVFAVVMSESKTIRSCEVAAFIKAYQPYINERSILLGHFQAADKDVTLNGLHQAGWVSVQVVNPPRWALPDLADNIYVNGSESWNAVNLCFANKEGCLPYLQFANSHHSPAAADIYFYDRPTNQPIKNETITVLPSAVNDVLQGAKAAETEKYHDLCAFLPWQQNNHTKIENDLLQTSVGSQDWSGGVNRSARLTGGQASILRFRYTPGSEFNIQLDDGQWAAEDYRRFGIYYQNDKFSIDSFHGKVSLWNDKATMRAKSGGWYDLLLAVGKDGSFRAVLWDDQSPKNTLLLKRDASSDWVRQSWNYFIGINKGQVEIESFTPLTFDGFK
jgi:hypothetical protein